MDETELLHTLDTEAQEAAVLAARASLRASDLCTPERLRQLADDDLGAVSEAAQSLLEEPNEDGPRVWLVLRCDVTALTLDQRGRLAGQLVAQTETQDDDSWEGEPVTGYPGVEYELDWEEADS